MTDIPEFVMAAFRQGAETKNDEEPVLPLKEAQDDMLREMLAQVRSAGSRRLEPGAEVHYAAGYGAMVRHARVGLVHRFWRYLDLSSMEDQHRVSEATEIELVVFPHLDCLTVSFDGRNFRFALSCSAMLRLGPLPEDEA